MKPLNRLWFETLCNDTGVRDCVRHRTKFIECLGGSVKDTITVWWTQLCVAAGTVLVSMT